MELDRLFPLVPRRELSMIATTPVPLTHVGVDSRGIAYVRGTRMKVLHLAAEANAGWSAEQIREAHPHLSLGQIHAALSYYHDHREEIDDQLTERDRFVGEILARHPNPLTRREFEERLKAAPSKPG